MINQIVNSSGFYYNISGEDILITGDIYSHFNGKKHIMGSSDGYN